MKTVRLALTVIVGAAGVAAGIGAYAIGSASLIAAQERGDILDPVAGAADGSKNSKASQAVAFESSAAA